MNNLRKRGMAALCTMLAACGFCGIQPITPVQGETFETVKLDRDLSEKLVYMDEDDYLTVGMWFTDIDAFDIEQEAMEIAGMDSLEDTDALAVQRYIEIKRSLIEEKYRNENYAYCRKYIPDGTILFVSDYAPFVVTKIQEKSIEEVSKEQHISSIGLYYDMQKTEETSKSIPNIHADYTRNTLSLKGSGVKVGILEMGYPDRANAQLRDRNVIFDVSDEQANQNISDHATRVTSIVDGKTDGIVPNSTVYVAASKDRIGDFKKIEWMLGQGVNVINFSAGYQNERGNYTDMAKWIDHLTNQADVTFVKSAGNCGSDKGITDPGMAYNAITVGSICENNSASEPDWSDDYFSADSAYLENTGGLKPDLTAPGVGINVAGFSNCSGTSYAAPHVTAVIAQMMQLKPDLKWKTSALNALLKAGTFHKTADDYNEYGLCPDYSDKEGAGVIDALGAYQTAIADHFMEIQIENQDFPFTKEIMVEDTSKPVRIAMNWKKLNVVKDGAVIDRALSDLDLYVYQPDGTLARSSCSSNNNTELVEFMPNEKGKYQIVVEGYLIENDYEVIGLSWNQ
jgi:serine protease AprX